jgi:hypothetical protein
MKHLERTMRLQLALNVKNLDQAISYYSKMFDATPHKVKDGYANFAIEEPALKLVLFESPQAKEQLNHLGVEMFEATEIENVSQRFAEAGILKTVQIDSVCCHAEQDKVWSKDDSNPAWEWYMIKDDNPAEALPDAAVCGDDAPDGKTACC